MKLLLLVVVIVAVVVLVVLVLVVLVVLVVLELALVLLLLHRGLCASCLANSTSSRGQPPSAGVGAAALSSRILRQTSQLPR